MLISQICWGEAANTIAQYGNLLIKASSDWQPMEFAEKWCGIKLVVIVIVLNKNVYLKTGIVCQISLFS